MLSNPKTLKDFILRTLGAPIVNVEVTEAQIYDCIQRTIDLFGEYHYDGSNRAYAVYKVSKEEAMSGVLDLRGKNVFAVTRLLRTGQSSYSSFGGTPYNWFSDMILSFSGGTVGGGCSSFYSPLSPASGGMSYFTQLSSYFGMMTDQFNPITNYWFNESNEQLHITDPMQEGDAIVCEVYVKSYSNVDMMINDTIGYGRIGACTTGDFNSSYMNPDAGLSINAIGSVGTSNSQGVYSNRWVKEYATALVKELNGHILAKHQGMQMPGGVTIDGVRILEEARQDKLRLEQEIMMLDVPVPILMG